MTIKKAVEQTIDSGIHPIVLDAQRVKNYAGDIEGVRTSLIVKSIILGTLTANEYRYMARRTKQAVGLVSRNIEKLFYFYPSIKEEHPGAKFFTISVYAKTLWDGELVAMLQEELRKYPHVETDKICLEMSADMLFENLAEYKKQLEIIKQMGFKIALCEVGSEFCPLLRLHEIPYDIVFMDNYLANRLDSGENDQEVAGVLNIIATKPVKIYGSCVTAQQIPLLEKIGADGYTVLFDEDLEEREWRVCAKQEEESLW